MKSGYRPTARRLKRDKVVKIARFRLSSCKRVKQS